LRERASVKDILARSPHSSLRAGEEAHNFTTRDKSATSVNRGN
jgi:hypothetical protein